MATGTPSPATTPRGFPVGKSPEEMETRRLLTIPQQRNCGRPALKPTAVLGTVYFPCLPISRAHPNPFPDSPCRRMRSASPTTLTAHSCSRFNGSAQSPQRDQRLESLRNTRTGKTGLSDLISSKPAPSRNHKARSGASFKSPCFSGLTPMLA